MISSRGVQYFGEAILKGFVHKVVKNPGTGRVVPQTAEVTLTLNLFVAQKSRGKEREHCNLDWRYEHSKNAPLVRMVCEIMPFGLQLAVRSMSAGEQAYVWIHPLFGFGSSGLVYGEGTLTEAIPPNSALVYEICLIGFRDSAMTLETALAGVHFGKLRFEEMQIIYNYREKALELMKKGRKPLALRTLCRAIKMLGSMRIDGTKEPQHNELREKIRLDTLKVAAELAIELGWFRLAVTFSKTILECEFDNAFASYLLGRAYFALGCNTNAKRCLRQAYLYDMKNQTYSAKLSEIERHMMLLGDSDSDDALEDHEELAEIISCRLQKNSKRIIKDIDRQIQEHVKAHRSTISIKGGFSDTILTDIIDRLAEKNKGTDSVIVKRLYNELEINIP